MTYKIKKCQDFPSAPAIPAATTLCFTVDSSRLIIAGTDASISVVDLLPEFPIVKRFKHYVASIDQEKEMIGSLAVSADGQWLASGDLLNQINIWNLDTLLVCGRDLKHSTHISAVTLTLFFHFDSFKPPFPSLIHNTLAWHLTPFPPPSLLPALPTNFSCTIAKRDG